MVPVLDPSTRWECPSCGLQHVRAKPVPLVPRHDCPAQKGLSVPLVQIFGRELPKNSVRHVVVEREDFIGDAQGVIHDADGRAVMAVHTQRADGSHDCQVFVPQAVGRIQL